MNIEGQVVLLFGEGGSGQNRTLFLRTPLTHFPHLYIISRLSPWCALFPFPVNKETDFSYAIFSFFPLFSALFLLVTSLKSLIDNISLHYVTTTKEFPILPKVSLSVLAKGEFSFFSRPRSLKIAGPIVSQITFEVLLLRTPPPPVPFLPPALLSPVSAPLPPLPHY